MNISLFISGVTGGGAEKVACAIASYLVKKEHNVELITMLDEEATYPLDAKVTRYSLLKTNERKGFVYNNALRLIRFVRYLISNKPDAYLVMLPTNIISLLYLKIFTTSKIIAAERANPDSYSNKTQKRLCHYAYKADAWVFQTEEQMKWYNQRCNLKSTIIIPNAINQDVLKSQYKCKKEKIIVTAGRLTEQKNHMLLIDAFSIIAEKYKDYSLVIYGEGPQRNDLLAKIESLNLKNRVYLPGYSKNVVDDIGKASLFVLSSYFEGMPNALMEAMALGVPSISTDCGGGGARYLIDNGRNGLLVPVDNINTLAEAMDKVLSDDKLAYSLGQEAFKLREQLAPNAIYEKWEIYIKNVIEQ